MTPWITEDVIFLAMTLVIVVTLTASLVLSGGSLLGREVR